jgi:hypothetical protein
MFGLGGDHYQGQQGPWSAGPGPLGDLQNQVAGVLNAADQNHIYVPTGPGNPIITLPRPQIGYRSAGYRPPAVPVYTGSHRSAERLTLGDVGVLLLGLTVVAGVVAAIAGVALLLIT